MLDIYKTAKLVHHAIYKRCGEIEPKIATAGTAKRLTDLAFILDSAIKNLEDAITMLKRLRVKVSDAACIVQLEMMTGEPLEGVFATGNAKRKKMGGIPSRQKEPEKYHALCEALGVEDTDLTRVHFPTLGEKLSSYLEQGLPIPANLEPFAKYEEVSFVVKGRNDNTIDELAADETGLLGEK